MFLFWQGADPLLAGDHSSFGWGPLLLRQGAVPLLAGDHFSFGRGPFLFWPLLRVTSLLSLLKSSFLSASDVPCAVSFVVFALDSPEREKREGSTTPCGVKDVVGPGSRTQSDWLRGENRMSTSTDNNACTVVV